MDEGRKVDVRPPGKGDSNSHGARPVHLIISMTKWIRTGRLSTKNSHTVLGIGRDTLEYGENGRDLALSGFPELSDQTDTQSLPNLLLSWFGVEGLGSRVVGT